MSAPILTVWLPFPLADAGPILDAAIQDQIGRREPDTEHCWGVRCYMRLQEGNVRWTPLREACVIDLLEGRLFGPGQIVQRSVQVLSVNRPSEKAGIRLECWHCPPPHDEGADEG